MTPTTPRQILVLCATTIVLLSSFSTNAAAAPITFTFNGDVTLVNPFFISEFSIGDDMTGSLTYDSELVDSNASATVGDYAPLSSFAFAVGNDTFSFVDGSGSIQVRNEAGADQLIFRADVTGAAIGGFKPFRVSLGLVGNSSTLSSDALPTAFDASDFALLRTFTVSFTNRANPNDVTSPGTNFTGIQGTLSGSAGAANVPEPATLTLLCSGMAGLALRRRQQRRSAKINA